MRDFKTDKMIYANLENMTEQKPIKSYADW